MRRGILLDIAFVALSPFIGVLLAVSTARWEYGWENGRRQEREAKRELLAVAGLMELHHKVYAEVGERDWEGRVKPQFLSALTRETVRSTGDLAPDWRDVVRWAREHPERARELLRAAAHKPP